MKKTIIYCSIQSDHILAVPEETHREVIEVSSMAKLQRYIETKKDDYGHRYKKSEKTCKSFGFDYISIAGGVKVEDYKPPTVKKI